MDNKPRNQFNSILDYIVSQPNEREAMKQLTSLRDVRIGENAEFNEISAIRLHLKDGTLFNDAMSITVVQADGEECLFIYTRDLNVFLASGTNLQAKLNNGNSIGIRKIGVQTDDSAGMIEHLTEILDGISYFMDLFEIEHLTFKEQIFGAMGPPKKVIIYVTQSGERKIFQEQSSDYGLRR